MSRRGWLAFTATVVVALAAGFAGVGAWRGWFTHPSVEGAADLTDPAVVDVVTGLDVPWSVAFLPDGSALVTERDSARILSVRGGVAQEVAHVAEVQPDGEGGLLGIAVSQDYPTDRWIYIYYTAVDDNRIARLRLDDPTRVIPIFVGIPKADRHNGGRIAFGPDGMLYAGTGDALVESTAQDRSSSAGKILRLTTEGAPAPGNPFGANPAFSYGHRNVQGLAWDANGVMFASEFGQNTYDELNRIEPGGNYGWPEAEGVSGDERFIEPVATWSVEEASPSGIAIGAAGHVWMACLRGERLYRIGTDGSDARAVLRERHGRLRDVATAPDGTLWVLTSNRDGRGNAIAGDDRILSIRP